jgi:putative PIG3 family NAD(P)H quinone oxidoreductase
MIFRRSDATSQPAVPRMRGMRIDAGKLVAAQCAIPACGAQEVLVRVAYAGVNHADMLQVAGQYDPPEGASPLPGMEVSGTIAQVGAEVVGWSVGEEVCALISGGGYAEYVNVPAAQVLALPNRVSLKEAASLPEAAATSYMALALEAQLQPGERVLVHGGTSGVGIIMAQLALAWGAQVFATVGSEEKAALLTKRGIDAINHRTSPFAEQVMAATQDEGVDVIIDTLGGPQLTTHLKLLRRGGRLVTLAMLEGNIAESVKITGLLMKHLRWSGATLRSRTPAEKAAIIEGVRKRIWPHLATGAIRPLVDSTFPLDEAEKAHRRMQERLHMGKILLEVPQK